MGCQREACGKIHAEEVSVMIGDVFHPTVLNLHPGSEYGIDMDQVDKPLVEF